MRVVITLYVFGNNYKGKNLCMFSTEVIFFQMLSARGGLNPWVQNPWVLKNIYT